jgi:hypothetical protein
MRIFIVDIIIAFDNSINMSILPPLSDRHGNFIFLMKMVHEADIAKSDKAIFIFYNDCGHQQL